jgi:site-specific recombinase XerD
MALLKINGKAAKQRSLFVTDKLYDLYSKRLQNIKDKNAFIFPGKEDKRPLSEDAVRKHINKIIEDNKLGFKVTPHMLRHAFASAMYNEAGAEMDEIKEMLGHDSIRETARYIHLPKEKIKQALAMLTLKGNSYVY